MRTIKFRGKRTDNGEWIYGSLLIWENGDCEIMVQKSPIDCDKISVGADTVGQFTGLLDKNGKEIYEGDILLMDCFDMDLGQYTRRMVVRYESIDSNDGTQWSWFTLTEIDEGTEYAFLKSKRMTVIGSIHDNPELLKGGKE